MSAQIFPIMAPTAQPTVTECMQENRLLVHLQPIIDMAKGSIFGHEALVRTPADSPWPNPDALFAAARTEGCALALELHCLRLAMRLRPGIRGRLFVNLSAEALLHAMTVAGPGSWQERGPDTGLPLSGVVVELTEHERVQDLHGLQQALDLLRLNGGTLALDDFGDGRSSLRLWSELRPEYVKIDKYFVRDVHQSSHKLKTLSALQALAETFGSRLVAEGVEQADELMVLRDMGLHFAQGFFLGRPQRPALEQLPPAALQVLHNHHIAVLPVARQACNRGLSAKALLKQAPSLPVDATHDDAAKLLRAQPDMHAVALVQDQVPVGLISRKTLQDLYLELYFRDLYGRRPCTLHANQKPLLVDIHTPIEQLTSVLTSDDQRYLTEGYIITEGGRYIGLGTGEQLVRTVTEARIEAARHANPLTFLPGNVPLTQHIERLLENGQDFVACYADLNHFKVFNDYYGYWRGDEMIRLQAKCLSAACDPRRDFIGHVGGDDFVLLMQSLDSVQRIEAAVTQFNQLALGLFDEKARTEGGIRAEDRHGVERFHPCTTLSAGLVMVAPGRLHSAEEVASAAAVAKHHAKQARLGVYLMDAMETVSA